MKKYSILSFMLIVALFSGCSIKNENFARSIFQTSGATLMQNYQIDLNMLLIKLEYKLYKRNPEIFTKNTLSYLQYDIKHKTNSINLPLIKDFAQDNFKTYLKIAFSKNEIKERGDYLIVGLYKMFYFAYNEAQFHKISALQYNKKRLEFAYKILQVVDWKIKTARSRQGKYLFLTWQNNWQIELYKRLKKGESLSAKLINNLEYIKDKKESLFSPSNLSFEVVFAKMQYIFTKSLKTVGVEPSHLSVSALRSIFLMM